MARHSGFPSVSCRAALLLFLAPVPFVQAQIPSSGSSGTACRPPAEGCLSVSIDLPTALLQPSLVRHVYRPRALLQTLRDELPIDFLPYSCRPVGSSLREVSLLVPEPLVPLGAADSAGLPPDLFEEFLADRRNYVLMDPLQSAARDLRSPAEWLPRFNACRWVALYALTKDRWRLDLGYREGQAIQDVLSTCGLARVLAPTCEDRDAAVIPPPLPSPPPAVEVQVWADLCDSDGDGLVTCAEASSRSCAGPVPVPAAHPLYPLMVDADRDGFVCR